MAMFGKMGGYGSEYTFDSYDTNLAAPPSAGGDEDEKTASHYLRLRGLPYSAKEADIRKFFEGLAVDEVQLTLNSEGRASGECYVSFKTVADAENGLLRDKDKIGTRYVEVFRIGEVEFSRVSGRPQMTGNYPPTPGMGMGPPPPGYGRPLMGPSFGGGMGGGPPGGDVANAIKVRGLPYSCKKEELIGFFEGLTVEEVVFGKEPGNQGRASGEAMVRFRTVEDASKAMELNGQHLGKRYLELFHTDTNEFEYFKRQMTSTAMPLNAVQPDWAPWYGGPQDSYGEWGGYGAPMPPPGRRGGGYRGGRGGHPHRGYGGYDAGPRGYDMGPPPRPFPYDYHGRNYGGDMGGYDGYDAYHGYPPSYGGQINYSKIYMRGLPFRVTSQQISDFFAPLNCVEIKLGYLPDGRVAGDGFVEFESPEEAQKARQKDRQSINNRYIEIFDNAVKATPGTTYKRVGGTGRYSNQAAAAAYQW